MNCREFIEFLWKYLSEDLSADERIKFEAHLARCKPCVSYLKSYQETIKLGKIVFPRPDEPVPNEVPNELVQAILSSREKAA